MKRFIGRRIAAAAALACLLFVGACSDSDPVSPTTEVKFKELTDRENVIYNFTQSYKYCDIDEYAKLLHDDYIWNNQEEDVVMNGLDPFWDRDQDIARTGAMFSARLHSYPDTTKWLDRLSLSLYAGPWAQVTEVGGQPCEDCWETTRAYSVELYMPYQELAYLAQDLVKFTVVAVEANGRTEYRIIRADDIADR